MTIAEASARLDEAVTRIRELAKDPTRGAAKIGDEIRQLEADGVASVLGYTSTRVMLETAGLALPSEIPVAPAAAVPKPAAPPKAPVSNAIEGTTPPRNPRKWLPVVLVGAAILLGLAVWQGVRLIERDWGQPGTPAPAYAHPPGR